MAKQLKQSKVKKWTAETLLAQLRRTPIVVAAGIAKACVAHCKLILARLRLVMDQAKNAMKQLERLCSAVAELSPTNGSAGEPCSDPEILRSMPGVGPIVLAALLSEGHDAIARRDVQVLRAGVVPVTRRSGKQYMLDVPNLEELQLHNFVRVSAADVAAMQRHPKLRAFEWYGEKHTGQNVVSGSGSRRPAKDAPAASGRMVRHLTGQRLKRVMVVNSTAVQRASANGVDFCRSSRSLERATSAMSRPGIP